MTSIGRRRVSLRDAGVSSSDANEARRRPATGKYMILAALPGARLLVNFGSQAGGQAISITR
jgi:hypothetical protein